MRIIFHVGYPKCGSTSIQKHILREFRGINYISEDAKPNRPFHKCPYPMQFTRCLMAGYNAEAVNIWKARIAPKLAERSTNVFSREALIFGENGTQEVLNVIHLLHANAEIMIFIRDQVDIIRSNFDMKRGHAEINDKSNTPQDIDEYINSLFDDHNQFLRPLEFGRVYEEAVDLFGSHKVWLFTFDGVFRSKRQVEDLAKSFRVSVSDLENALKAPPAISAEMSAGQHVMRRVMGPIRGHWFLPPTALRAINRRVGSFLKRSVTQVPGRQKERIRQYFASDNSRLAEVVPEIGPLS